MTIMVHGPGLAARRIALAAISLAVIIAITPCRADDGPAAPASPATTAPRFLDLTGELAARAEVKVFARVSGPLLELRVREGNTVRAGDVVARIDPVEYELAVAQSTADLAAAEGRWKALEAGGRPEERARSQADVRSAEAVCKEDERRLERLVALHAKGGASGEAVDGAYRARDVDRERLVSAQKSLALVNEGARIEDKKVGLANLERARADLRLAQLRLDYTKVRAPFSGRVVSRPVDEGAYVLSASTPGIPAVCVLSDCETMKVLVEVPEKHLAFLRLGAEAAIVVQAFAGSTFTGKAVALYPQVDQQTRRAKLEIQVPNRELRLLPGMFAKVRVPLADREVGSLSELMAGRSASPDR